MKFQDWKTLDQFYEALTNLLNEFKLVGDRYWLFVCILKPPFVYKGPARFKVQQNQMAAEQNQKGGCGNALEFAAVKFPQEPMNPEVYKHCSI